MNRISLDESTRKCDKLANELKRKTLAENESRAECEKLRLTVMKLTRERDTLSKTRLEEKNNYKTIIANHTKDSERVVNELKSKLSTISEERDRLKESMTQQIGQLNSVIEKLQADKIDHLKQNAELFKNDKEKLLAELEKYKSNNQELENANAKVSHENSVLLKEKEAHVAHTQLVSHKVGQLESEKQNLQKELELLKSAKADLSSKLSGASKDAENKVQVLGKICQKLGVSEDAPNAVDKVEELKLQLNDYQNLKQQFAELQGASEKLSKANEELEALKQTCNNLSNEKQSATAQLEELQNLKQQLNDLQNSSNQTDELDTLQQECNKLAEEKQALASKFEDLQSKLANQDQLNSKLNQMDKSQEELSQKVQLFNQICETLEVPDGDQNVVAKIDQLKCQLSDYDQMKASLDDMANQVSEARLKSEEYASLLYETVSSNHLPLMGLC